MNPNPPSPVNGVPPPVVSAEEKRLGIIRVLKRRSEVSALLLQRVSCRAIAQRLDVSVRTVWRDRQKLLEAWSREAGTRIDLQVGRELAALDQDELTLRVAMAAEANPVVRLKFFDRIARIQEARRSLLGLDAATKVGVRFEGSLNATAEIRDKAWYQAMLADPETRAALLAEWRRRAGMAAVEVPVLARGPQGPPPNGHVNGAADAPRT